MTDKLEAELSKLEASIAQLNDRDDENVQKIEDCEDKLEQIRVGVSYWMPSLLLMKGAFVDPREGYQLGYRKLAKRWRIAVRQVRAAEVMTPVKAPEGMTALEGTRVLRAEVQMHLVDLVAALNGRVAELLAEKGG